KELYTESLRNTTLMNNMLKYRFQVSGFRKQNRNYKTQNIRRNNCSRYSLVRVVLCTVFLPLFFTSCGIYTFKDVSIPPEVKTVKINFIENRASYKNPQLSPRLTDQLQQKIANQTRLTRTNSDDAHYQIRGYIS